METSGDAGVSIVPAMVSSSAAISEPSCNVRRCGRKNISAARSTYGSSQPSSALRRITCTSWLRNSGGVAPRRCARDRDRPLRASGAHQMIAERDHHLPVLARIRVRDRGDLVGGDRPARIGQQRRMQRALDHAGVRRRRELRPRQIDLEELVGHRRARRPRRGRADDGRRRARNPSLPLVLPSASFDQIDLLARLLLALDLEERERAHRLLVRRAAAACGTPRGSRRPRSVRCTAISVSSG